MNSKENQCSHVPTRKYYAGKMLKVTLSMKMRPRCLVIIERIFMYICTKQLWTCDVGQGYILKICLMYMYMCE